MEEQNMENKEANPPQSVPQQARPQKVNISSYHDPEGLSVAKMDTGFWILSHKENLINSAYFVFFLFSIIAW